jgi:hypothetical protein
MWLVSVETFQRYRLYKGVSKIRYQRVSCETTTTTRSFHRVTGTCGSSESSYSHDGVVSPYNPMEGILGTWSNAEVRNLIAVCVWTVSRRQCAYCAKYMIMRRQTLTSCDPDFQARPQQRMMCVAQMPLSEKSDELSLTSCEGFRWVVRTVLSTIKWSNESCVHAPCQRTSQIHKVRRVELFLSDAFKTLQWSRIAVSAMHC